MGRHGQGRGPLPLQSRTPPAAAAMTCARRVTYIISQSNGQRCRVLQTRPRHPGRLCVAMKMMGAGTLSPVGVGCPP